MQLAELLELGSEIGTGRRRSLLFLWIIFLFCRLLLLISLLLFVILLRILLVLMMVNRTSRAGDDR